MADILVRLASKADVEWCVKTATFDSNRFAEQISGIIEASKAKPTFTAEQGAAAFARQGLGSVIEWTELEANPTNCVYKAVCCDGSYVIKIKYRKAFSLAVDFNITALLRDTCHSSRNKQLPLRRIRGLTLRATCFAGSVTAKVICHAFSPDWSKGLQLWKLPKSPL